MNPPRNRHLPAILASLCIVLPALPGCRDSTPRGTDAAPSSGPRGHLGLWVDTSEDFEAEVEFYDDGGVYYYYADPNEVREGSGSWRIEQGRYVFEMDNDMTYFADVTFPSDNKMVIGTDSAGRWTFQRPTEGKRASEQ